MWKRYQIHSHTNTHTPLLADKMKRETYRCWLIDCSAINSSLAYVSANWHCMLCGCTYVCVVRGQSSLYARELLWIWCRSRRLLLACITSMHQRQEMERDRGEQKPHRPWIQTEPKPITPTTTQNGECWKEWSKECLALIRVTGGLKRAMVCVCVFVCDRRSHSKLKT